MTETTTSTPIQPPSAGARFRAPTVTRRGLQIVLGLVWLLDGGLQLQPFMFGSGFADQVLAPAGNGQPGWVADGVRWAAGLVGGSPTLWDALFAAVQVGIGIGLLVRPLVRFALIGSVVWGLGVWYLGEGVGGIASGHGSLLTGAPGAVLLYVLLAAVAWPKLPADAPAGWRGWLRQDGSVPPAAWTPAAWAVVWIGGAVLQALPGQNKAGEIADALSGATMPSWLAAPVNAIADGIRSAGAPVVWLLLAVFVAVGLCGLGGRRLRLTAGWVGFGLAALFWVFGEGLGNLASGQSTDPNSAPLLALLAVALLGTAVAVPAGEPEPGDAESVSAGGSSDWRRSVLSGVSALAVVGVGLLLWITTQPAQAGPPPHLTVTAVYTPSGDGATAPVYFKLTNTGAGSDTLLSAGAEFQTGTTVKSVTVCAGPACMAGDTVTIPAHGTVVFSAGGPHLIAHGSGMLAVGHQPLQLTLTFARSGLVHVLSPVGSPADLTFNDVMTYGYMGHANPGMGMSDMNGMTGTSGAPMTSMPGMTMSGG
jgi:copper(I)-binding protein